MVRSQTGSQGINWWSMATMSTGAIAPRVIAGIFLERYIVSGLTTGAGKQRRTIGSIQPIFVRSTPE
jgi:multiple sugar transport system permease protein